MLPFESWQQYLPPSSSTLPQHRRWSPGDSPDVTLADQLTRSAREEVFLAHFWGSYLPNGQVFPSEAAQYATGGWTNVVQQLYPANDVLRKALLANGLSSLGHRDGQRWMIEKGIEAYGAAMAGMRRALAVQTPKSLSEGTVAAVRLMIMYSVCAEKESSDDELEATAVLTI